MLTSYTCGLGSTKEALQALNHPHKFSCDVGCVPPGNTEEKRINRTCGAQEGENKSRGVSRPQRDVACWI